MDTDMEHLPDDLTRLHNEAGERANALMIVGDSKLIPVLFALAAVSFIVAGLALGIALWSNHTADQARMEARLLQVKVEGFEKALWAARIDPNPHLPGQPE